VCHASSAGRACQAGTVINASSRTRTGGDAAPAAASPTSRRSSRRVTPPTARPSRCTSTATTSATCSRQGNPASGRRSFYFDDSAPQRGACARLESHLRGAGRLAVRRPPLPLAFPRIVNLRMDPFEAHVNFSESRWPCAGWRQDVGLRADAALSGISCSRSGSSRSARSRELQHRPVMKHWRKAPAPASDAGTGVVAMAWRVA